MTTRKISLKQLAQTSANENDTLKWDGSSWVAAAPAVSTGTGVTDGDKGDISVSGTGTVWTIDPGAVTLEKMANLAATSLIGNATGSVAAPIALTGTQVTALLDAFAGTTKGLVPAPVTSSGKFLRDDGTWAEVSVVGVTDGDKGDITVSGSGATWTIDPNTVTLAKLAQVSTATFLGRTTAATGNVESLTAAQATALLSTFTTTTKGLVPSPTTSSGKFLKDDGTWDTAGGASSNQPSWLVSATSTGSPQTLTLPENGLTAQDVMVTIGGLVQDPADYTVVGTTLTLTALDSGVAIMARRLMVPYSLAVTPYSIPFGFGTGPSASEILLIHVFAEAISLPANFAGFVRYVGTNPTGSYVLTLKKNGTSIGTLTIGTDGTVTGSTTGAVTFAVGDALTVTAPASTDATLANCGFTLKGART